VAEPGLRRAGGAYVDTPWLHGALANSCEHLGGYAPARRADLVLVNGAGTKGHSCRECRAACVSVPFVPVVSF